MKENRALGREKHPAVGQVIAIVAKLIKSGTKTMKVGDRTGRCNGSPQTCVGRHPATHASGQLAVQGPRLCQETVATLFRGGGDPMATARLRVFPRPEDEAIHEVEHPAISIRLADLYPLLAHAFRDNYSWLQDFEHDRVLVSEDLYEVVRAFSNYRPSA
jgi:hypothetical protein